ncbi:MAG: TonB-dependent receptor [Gammaproteobacteria bacterium]|nr:MAG: TonB-dependent receptor [Gammaproteobacteria bacterium]
MIRIAIVLALLGHTLTATAWQQTRLLAGYVEDAESGERLSGAHVYEWYSGRGAVTDNYGYFALQIPADSVRLRITYTGYETRWIDVSSHEDTLLFIELSPGELLPQVEVRSRRLDLSPGLDRQTLSIAQINTMPAFLGESDVLKALSVLPGVMPGQEGQSAIFVRGGGRDQNLVLLDGVPLYFTNHLAGFFSVFNPDALKQVQLYKGGFPASYGGRLSSVLDLTMKEGHLREWHAKGAVGLLSGRLTVEGPIVPERASVLLAARRSWTDLVVFPMLFRLAGYEPHEIPQFWFRDLNLKANWIVNDRNRLFASGYLGRDFLNFSLLEALKWGDFLTTTSGTRWDNATLSLRWQSIVRDELTATWVAHYTRYRLNMTHDFILRDSMEQELFRFESNLLSGVREGGLSASLFYAGLTDHELRFGASSVWRELLPFKAVQHWSNPDSTTLLSPEPVAQTEYALWLSDRWQRGPWTIEGGVRFAGVAGWQFRSSAPELRLKVMRALPAARMAWLAFDQMRQYLHLAQSETVSLPTERWLPATATLPPERSWQLSAGVSLPDLLGGSFVLGAYFKKMYNLVTWAEGISFVRPQFEDWEAELVKGSGEAWGIEWQWQRQTKRYEVTLAGTFSRSWRHYPEKNLGRRFPHLYDRPVALNGQVLWRVSERFQVAAFWTLASGIPQTLLERRFSVPVDFHFDWWGYPSIGSALHYAYEYGPMNGFRLPPHHRLDLSARWYKKKKHYERWWVAGVYNAFVRANPMYLHYDAANEKYTAIGAFPIMPFVALEFDF